MVIDFFRYHLNRKQKQKNKIKTLNGSPSLLINPKHDSLLKIFLFLSLKWSISSLSNDQAILTWKSSRSMRFHSFAALSDDYH